MIDQSRYKFLNLNEDEQMLHSLSKKFDPQKVSLYQTDRLNSSLLATTSSDFLKTQQELHQQLVTGFLKGPSYKPNELISQAESKIISDPSALLVEQRKKLLTSFQPVDPSSKYQK